MRFRIWHLLAAMAFVALWIPLSQGLLALEAQDHPWKPQGTIDVVGFYLGTAAIVILPAVIGLTAAAARRQRKLEHEQELLRFND